MTSLLAEFARQFFLLLAQMAPWLLLGFLLAGILHVWVPSRLYVPKLSGRSFKSVLLATLFGIPLPICSCGTMPTAVALRREGAGKGACVGFLISTPATGADSILATWSLLGLPFALLRPVAAFLTALFGGALANFLTRGEPEETPGNAQETLSGAKGAHASLRGKLRETLRYGFVEMVGNIGKWLFVGLLLGALVATAVPDGFFAGLRSSPLLCMLLVLALTMPMYTCATGSIPLALALIEKGLTPGAALVLLMAGPATSVASMLVVGKAFGKRTLAAYLLSIAGGAFLFGFLVDSLWMEEFLATLPLGGCAAHGHGGTDWTNVAAAVLLSALALNALLPRRAGKKSCGCGKCGCGENGSKEVAVRYRVEGMSCGHCKACVEKAVAALPGVESAVADVAGKSLSVVGNVDEKALKEAVEKAGFGFGGKS